jgi:hypothetical protein
MVSTICAYTWAEGLVESVLEDSFAARATLFRKRCVCPRQQLFPASVTYRSMKASAERRRLMVASSVHLD